MTNPVQTRCCFEKTRRSEQAEQQIPLYVMLQGGRSLQNSIERTLEKIPNVTRSRLRIYPGPVQFSSPLLLTHRVYMFEQASDLIPKPMEQPAVWAAALLTEAYVLNRVGFGPVSVVSRWPRFRKRKSPMRALRNFLRRLFVVLPTARPYSCAGSASSPESNGSPTLRHLDTIFILRCRPVGTMAHS